MMPLQNIFAQRFGSPPAAFRPVPQAVIPGQMPVQLPPARTPMQVQQQAQPMQPQLPQAQPQATQPLPQNNLRRMMMAR